MNVGELKALLTQYSDNQLVLVEHKSGGFDEPQIYITAARPNRADESNDRAVNKPIEVQDGKGVGSLLFCAVKSYGPIVFIPLSPQKVTTKCNFCDEVEGLEWHHIIPRSLGGTDDDFNMLLVCNVHHALLHSMKQRGNIRELTKRGLERAKANGKKLGASREVIARASQKGGRTVAKNADDFAMSLLPVIEEMRERGLSLRAMAGELNNKKVETARGGMWAVTTVKNLIDRLTATGNLKFPSLVKRSPWEEAIRRSIDD